MTSKAADPVYWPGWRRGEERLKKSERVSPLPGVSWSCGKPEAGAAQAAKVDEMRALDGGRGSPPSSPGLHPSFVLTVAMSSPETGCMTSPSGWSE